MKKFTMLFFLITVGSLSAQWYNLQWPPTATITEGNSVNVYAKIWISGVTDSPGQGGGVSAWIGVSSVDTDPSTWPDSVWVAATYNGDTDGNNNDEYTAAIGSTLPAGTYYYASRFLYSATKIKNSEVSAPAFWYGGTGGPWNNDNGVLTVNALPTIGWANLQWPPSATINVGDSVDVYAYVWVDGVTNVGSPGAGIGAWIGVSSTNTNPATWDSSAWIPANFLNDVYNNDQYTLSIGSSLAEGTYYYASRFQNQNGPYYYGGHSSGGGGAWDSTNNISGILTVSAVPDTVIDWANLQWPPEVSLIDKLSFTVYGQIYEAGVTDDTGKGPGIEAWFGINTENTDPATWSDSNWISGIYNVSVGNNDEYMAELNLAQLFNDQGDLMYPSPFYYAARYRLNGGDYYYGGFKGGAWDGTNNVNGVGTFELSNSAAIGWCNLQWPPTMDLEVGESGTVYAQMWIDGLTNQDGPTDNIVVFIGVNNEDTDPSLWPTEAWSPADYNVDVGNNDEYMADIGANLESGTYYYASRFVVGGIKSFYGGYNEGGGGFWDGTNNISGILTIESNVGPAVDWCNLQWPPEGVITEGTEYEVYAQVWEDGITSTEGATEGLSAWIGISTENTNPNTWNEDAWKAANFNVDVGNNDEFMLDIGPFLTQGTYYYASRFQLEDGPYAYGGYNEGGGGFWDGSSNASGIVIVDPILSVDEEEIPTVYSLEQNYPNPFNPSTKIRFSIPSQSSVKLKIYNIMGEEVAVIENGVMETGIHEINWNASNLSSGVYLLRIEASSTNSSNEFIDMKKMILMK